jgi:hypothetical protein
VPKDLLNLRSFLGLTGYFRDLINDYAKIAQLLTDLMHKADIPEGAGKAVYCNAMRKVLLQDIWTIEHQHAFLQLKHTITLEPVLIASRFDRTLFIMTTNRCKEGFNTVLTQ